MASKKQLSVPGIGEVTFTKRKGNTNIRLSYARDGSIRVSLPYFVPYEAGVAFVKSKSAWLEKHRPETRPVLKEGQRIGKAHRLHFSISTSAARPSTRVKDGRVTVTMPVLTNEEHEANQQAAERGAHKALKQEADQLLPQRVSQLAAKNGFNYSSLTSKRLSSRWGSCNQQRNIILNIYLMQLPWELIDYVIIHELVHTEYLNHSADFWRRFEQVMPDAKTRRKQLKSHQTHIIIA